MVASKALDGLASPGDVAETVSVSLLDRAWIRKSLELQRNSLVRARTKEMVGSEVYVLRGREIEALGALINRFS